jgi:hypothetical protein
MIKNEAIYSMTKNILLQEMMGNNKSIENVLNSNTKTDIALYEAYEQNTSIFSNPKDLYYLLTDFNSKNMFCYNDILKYSRNPDVVEFLERNCEKN